MNCNVCGTCMRLAILTDYGIDKIVCLRGYNLMFKECEDIGPMVYCPQCGNLQVELDKDIELDDKQED